MQGILAVHWDEDDWCVDGADNGGICACCLGDGAVYIDNVLVDTSAYEAGNLVEDSVDRGGVDELYLFAGSGRSEQV